MEFKFVTSDAKDLKRKRPHQACEACKKRKKRCFHGAEDEESAEDSPPKSAIPPVSIPLFAQPEPMNGPQQAPTYAVRQSASSGNDTNTLVRRSLHRPSISSKTSRFLGDTHAEANLEVEQGDPSDKRDQDNVGIWYDEEDDIESDPSQADAGHPPPPKGPLIREDDRQQLVRIFIARVQPLLPILEDQHTTPDGIRDIPETLSLAVCLVAAKDERARDYLRFYSNASALPVHLYARKLYRIILGRIENWRSLNRLELIRVLALISMHQEGLNGTEESTLNLSRAIQHAYLMGIHLKRFQANITNLKAHEDNTRLFWCLWSLDKIAAAIDGRPRMAYEMDVGLGFVESLPLFTTPGRLWMKMARLLSSVNDLYSPRPCVDTENHLKEFQRWEEILESEDVRDVDEGFLTTLELFYHSASMLSCRIKFLVGRRRAFASSLRRYLSAATVYSISKCTPASDLAPLPVVPYAYCLGTLVAYQQYRCAQRRIHRAIAEEKLTHFQEQLQTMASGWYAAKSMSRKVQRVLREFRRANTAGERQKTAIEGGSQIGSSHLSTISGSEIATPESYRNPTDGQPDRLVLDPHGANGQSGGGTDYGGAFADMDVMFGNLMDMNAFTGDIEFALDPSMSGGYDPAMWAGEGIAQ